VWYTRRTVTEQGSRAAPSGAAAESTIDLLTRAQAGDRDALDRVFAREIPPLVRWARGRLPGWAREMVDTDDLVQDTVTNTLRRIDSFEWRHDAALQAYLRQAVLNRIRNEIRRAVRHPRPEAADSGIEDPGASPLETLIGAQDLAAYDEALAALSESEREAVIGRVELGMSYAELAAAQQRPSADAARMAVGRALLKLGQLLKLE
jgi:RNA polymerase sigma factor (sigma-70 family)